MLVDLSVKCPQFPRICCVDALDFIHNLVLCCVAVSVNLCFRMPLGDKYSELSRIPASQGVSMCTYHYWDKLDTVSGNLLPRSPDQARLNYSKMDPNTLCINCLKLFVADGVVTICVT